MKINTCILFITRKATSKCKIKHASNQVKIGSFGFPEISDYEIILSFHNNARLWSIRFVNYQNDRRRGIALETNLNLKRHFYL